MNETPLHVLRIKWRSITAARHLRHVTVYQDKWQNIWPPVWEVILSCTGTKLKCYRKWWGNLHILTCSGISKLKNTYRTCGQTLKYPAACFKQTAESFRHAGGCLHQILFRRYAFALFNMKLSSACLESLTACLNHNKILQNMQLDV